MLRLRDQVLGGDNPCFIIAEIGQNHQGDIMIAKEMIKIAKECGVSCVKFQKTSLSHRFTKDALDAPYTSINSFGGTYGEHRAHLEFSEQDFKELQKYAENDIGIMFAASGMDIPSATFLASIGVPFMKIGSGDTNNPFLIEHVAKMNLPIILSTGMSDLETVRDAYEIIKRHHPNFALLHCVSAYPTCPKDVNLKVMQLYKRNFPGVPIGYSGHERGIAIAIAAVANGAKIIEKHFTLDNSMKGTDHECSLNPTQLRELVKGIREVEAAIGAPVKRFLKSEIPCHSKLGKTLVSARVIPEGATIQTSDIAVKVSRPPGLQPKHIKKIVGSITRRRIEEDMPLSFDDIEWTCTETTKLV